MMKTPFLMKTILSILFLLILSSCKQTKVVEETPVEIIDEIQSTATIVDENQSVETPQTPTAIPETLNEDLLFPIDDFSVAVEITHFGLENVDFELLQSLGVKYIRLNGILWSEIQPTEDVFIWDGMLRKEDFFRKANQYGMTVIPIVRGTPVWAQKVYGYYCGAILDEKLESFSLFMSEVVNRYKTEEYNIHSWEIWNEPDIQPEFARNTSPFGCWGNGNDPNYGGGNYAEMLKIISPVIKESDPSAKILIGGLLLDCDPLNVGDPGRCQKGKDLPPKFLEGILMNGGGEFFDIVSYHGYTSDGNFEFTPWVIEEEFPNWAARGGVVLGKFNFIKDLLNEYGYEKPVFLTETGFLCPEKNLACNEDKDTFYDRQAQYAVWSLVRNWIEGIEQSFWFTYNGPGWRESGILDKEQQPKPVYTAIQILNQRMQSAQSAQKLEDLPEGLQGYEINFEEHITWVVVSADNGSHLLDLSENDFSAYDIFNQEIERPAGKLEIFNPVYVDIMK